MNVSLQNSDSVNAIVKIQIDQADYLPSVDKALRNMRQKANIPGFRPGMAPMGLVKKMYEKSAIVEEINRMVSEQLFNYIKENNIQILGEPLPNLTEQKEVDFATQVDFEFCFDIAIAPALNLELSKKDSLPFYQIEVTEEAIEEQIKSYTQRFGTTEPVDNFEGKDMVTGNLVELDEEGNEKPDGHQAEGSLAMPFYFKNEIEKAKFDGAKKGDEVVFSPYVASGENESEAAHILKVDKEKVQQYQGKFKYTIKEITRFVPAKINQELFTKIYGENTTVKTEEEFKIEVKKTIEAMLSPEAEYKFGLDAKTLVENKIGEIQYPVEFLKRWLAESKEEKSPEELDTEMPQMLKELTWHLAKEKLVKENDIKINEEDLLAIAKVDAKMQFAQYGMNEVPEEYLVQYASEIIKKKENTRAFVDRAIEEKVFGWIKETIELQPTSISRDEFYKLLNEK